MGELEDNKQHDDTEVFEFAVCDVRAGTISKDAKLISRSDSEVQALQSLHEAEFNAQLHTVKINESEFDKKDEPVIPTVKITVSNTNSIDKPSKNVHVDVSEKNDSITLPEALSQDTLLVTPGDNHVNNDDPNNQGNLSNGNSEQRPSSPRHLSPKAWRKRAIRVPAGKKYKHTIFNEDLLAAYDIIDRKEMKSIENTTSSFSMFSLSQLKSKLKSAWLPERTAQTTSVDAGNPHTPAHSTVVQFSVEKTSDGEAMQVNFFGLTFF